MDPRRDLQNQTKVLEIESRRWRVGVWPAEVDRSKIPARQDRIPVADMKSGGGSIERADIRPEQGTCIRVAEGGHYARVSYADAEDRSSAAENNVRQSAGYRSHIMERCGQRDDLERGRQTEAVAERFIPRDLDKLELEAHLGPVGEEVFEHSLSRTHLRDGPVQKNQAPDRVNTESFDFHDLLHGAREFLSLLDRDGLWN